MNERVVALFCGSRGWRDERPIYADVEALPDDALVIEGGAAGADRLSGYWARKRGLHVAEVDALWGRFGPSAGPRRNAAMLLLLPTVVYAYSLGTPGTEDMIRRATAAGVPINVRTKDSP
jgi:hypothetical protein